MKTTLFLSIVALVILSSCSSNKSSFNYKKQGRSIANQLVSNALKYKGVRYKFGGVTYKGMDCSGVVYVAYNSVNITLPRVSRDMANKGREISLSKAKKGDLLFFKIGNNKRNINHVGLVISNKKGKIRFIHATTSKGVIISYLSEKYWKKALVKVNRVL